MINIPVEFFVVNVKSWLRLFRLKFRFSREWRLDISTDAKCNNRVSYEWSAFRNSPRVIQRQGKDGYFMTEISRK